MNSILNILIDCKLKGKSLSACRGLEIGYKHLYIIINEKLKINIPKKNRERPLTYPYQ